MTRYNIPTVNTYPNEPPPDYGILDQIEVTEIRTSRHKPASTDNDITYPIGNLNSVMAETPRELCVSHIPNQAPCNFDHTSRVTTNSEDDSSSVDTFGKTIDSSIPYNAVLIDTNIIESPEVDCVDARFIVSKKKFQFDPKNETLLRCSSIHQTSSDSSEKSLASSSSSLFSSPKLWYTGIRKLFINKKTKEPYDMSFQQRYRVTDHNLGVGASGNVKLALRTSDKKIVAVKEFHSFNPMESNLTKKEYFRKIQTEYSLCSMLKNHNIINTIEFVKADEKLIQIMDYIPHDLFTIVMDEQGFDYSLACCYFKQAVRGVQYLHNLGVAHRDLKLDNMVVTNEGTLKIIDFGVATVYKSPFNDNSSVQKNSIIMAGGVVGSEPYLPPEVYIFDKYDPRGVDIWSLGIIFVCMIVRKFPWRFPRLEDKAFKNFCLNRSDRLLSNLVSSPMPTSGELPFDTTQNKFGPNALLHCIPEEAQPLLLKMLDLSPVCRPTIDEVFIDTWMESIDECFQDGTSFIQGSDHTHTFACPSPLKALKEDINFSLEFE